MKKIKFVKENYNNELEEILSEKSYDEEVKNLLLDILYKIETAYNDYSKVKVDVLSKEEYLKNIIKIVKDCENIRFMTKEESKENKPIIINKEKKEILCSPIARRLLYSLAKMQKSENIIKSKIPLLNVALTNMLNVGNNINFVEPYRDFNGFSWNISILEIENFYYNLIYQDLIILVGNTFLEEWTNKNQRMIDYVELFKSEIEERYGKKIAKNILELLKNISILMGLKLDDEFKTNMRKRVTEIKEELEKMENKEIYLEEICKIKKELTKKIRNIDIIINNKKLLSDEYKKINERLPLEEKIFSMRLLAKNMSKQRDEILAKIEEYNKLMNPKNYRRQRENLQAEYKYVCLVETQNLDEQIYKQIILLQKEVLKCIKIKAVNSNEKADLLKVIYEMRYFNMIHVNEKKNISQISVLSKINTITKNEILNKALQLKLINGIFKNEDMNIEYLKNIFSLKIISLEDIHFKIIKEDDDYYVQFYDEDVIDEKFKLNLKEEGIKNENNIFRSNKNSNRFKLFS